MASEALETPFDSLAGHLSCLAQGASIELNVHDVPHLESSRQQLPGGTRHYISHLPGQSFEATLSACTAVRTAGYEPVPHMPVRLIQSGEHLHWLIDEAVRCGVTEVLLVSGDYPEALGPFSSVADVLRSIDLRSRGIRRLSIGGHPEGHAIVDTREIRQSELDKEGLARNQGLATTFVTQFFFEAEPFLRWAETLRANGASAAIRAGLAGPAKLSTLLRFAARCGVGPSIRALGSRPAAFAKLLGEHGPEDLLIQLAQGASGQPDLFQGMHLFCFGGYLRTCRWLHALSSGHFKLTAGGLSVAG